MSTLVSTVLRSFVALAVMFAMLAGPSLAYAAGGKEGAPPAKVSKVVAMTRAAKAKAQRAAMGGLSVAGNAAWSFGTGALAIANAAQHNIGGAAVLGAFSLYNGIQAVRKARVEKIAAEAE